jgi:hypothetical protein
MSRIVTAVDLSRGTIATVYSQQRVLVLQLQLFERDPRPDAGGLWTSLFVQNTARLPGGPAPAHRPLHRDGNGRDRGRRPTCNECRCAWEQLGNNPENRQAPMRREWGPVQKGWNTLAGATPCETVPRLPLSPCYQRIPECGIAHKVCLMGIFGPHKLATSLRRLRQWPRSR